MTYLGDNLSGIWKRFHDIIKITIKSQAVFPSISNLQQNDLKQDEKCLARFWRRAFNAEKQSKKMLQDNMCQDMQVSQSNRRTHEIPLGNKFSIICVAMLFGKCIEQIRPAAQPEGLFRFFFPALDKFFVQLQVVFALIDI